MEKNVFRDTVLCDTFILPATSTAQFSLSIAPTTGLNFNIESKFLKLNNKLTKLTTFSEE